MDTLTGWGMGEAEGWQDPYMDAHAGFLGFRWIQPEMTWPMIPRRSVF